MFDLVGVDSVGEGLNYLFGAVKLHCLAPRVVLSSSGSGTSLGTVLFSQRVHHLRVTDEVEVVLVAYGLQPSRRPRAETTERNVGIECGRTTDVRKRTLERLRVEEKGPELPDFCPLERRPFTNCTQGNGH